MYVLNSLEYVSINNQECKLRSEIMNANQCQELMKQDVWNGIKLVNVNVD